MSHKRLAEELAGDGLGFFCTVDKMDTALESSLFDVAEATATAKNLGLDDTAAWDAAGDSLSLVCAEGNRSHRDGDLERVKQSTSLVLVELKTAHRQRTITEDGSVEEPVREHHFYSKGDYNISKGASSTLIIP